MLDLAAESDAKNGVIPLWVPPTTRRLASRMFEFANLIDCKYGYRRASRLVSPPGSLKDYLALHKWSCEHTEDFWSELWSFLDLINAKKGDVIFERKKHIKDCIFFPDGYFSFAENVLRTCNDELFCTYQVEDRFTYSVTRRQAYEEVSRLTQALKDVGIKPGDVIVGVLANSPQALYAALATNSVGGVFSSSSPDFGASGLYDRFHQISPKVMFATDGYVYAGKVFDNRKKVLDLAKKIPSVHTVVFIQFFEDKPTQLSAKDLAHSCVRVTTLKQFIGGYLPQPIKFHRGNFNDPIWVLFSSGTTGLPKAIIHRNGCMLQLKKETHLQLNIGKGDKVLQFTTCGWMMWNWMTTCLSGDASVVLYEGSPLFPNQEVLWECVARNGCTFLGTSPKYLDQVMKSGIDFSKFDLTKLQTIGSTGSPLPHELFDFVYTKIKKDIWLVSISGGTDLVSSFIGGCLLGPVYRGEIQAPMLGMNVHSFDSDGKSVLGEAGELVCVTPWPSMPIRFAVDPGNELYFSTYFEKFPNVWSHGDWVEINPKTGGIIIHGRSDTVLNPYGVRIGTAEIYRQVEKVLDITDSLVICVTIKPGVDEIILFVTTRNNKELTKEIIKDIKDTIKLNASPRHVPHRIVKVLGIPRTITGKIAELAVKNIVMGKPVKNQGALKNPECLTEYEKYTLNKLRSRL